jgi:hypothetical protein
MVWDRGRKHIGAGPGVGEDPSTTVSLIQVRFQIRLLRYTFKYGIVLADELVCNKPLHAVHVPWEHQ